VLNFSNTRQGRVTAVPQLQEQAGRLPPPKKKNEKKKKKKRKKKIKKLPLHIVLLQTVTCWASSSPKFPELHRRRHGLVSTARRMPCF